MEDTKEDLKRVVGVFGLSSNIVNVIVGAGIFALPAIVAAGLGSSSIYAYLLCGVLVVLVMLCFAEAGSRITASGGAYIYIKTAFGPYFGFLTAILFIFAAIAADAAVANAVVEVFGSVFPVFKLPYVRICIILLFFAGFGYINVIGVKNGMRMVKFVTVVKLMPLLLIVIFSWGDVALDNLAIRNTPAITEIAEISLILFFAFQGAETSLSISGEVKDPKKNIPRAIFISILAVITLYILIQTVSQGVLGTSLAGFTENPLGAVASKVFGPVGFTIMTIGAAVSMMGYLSSSILSMPRILFRASKDNVLPVKLLTKIHPRYQTPYISIITYAGTGFLFASLGGFRTLAVIATATVLLIYLGVSLSVIKLKRGRPLLKSEFRIPGGNLVPILSSLTIVYLLLNLAQKEFIVIISFIAVLSILYLFKKKKLGKE
ncbi:amino acid/polyamine/organocation transporter (APC superfamily) [Christiangramia gaetbulicola]|uniref:Amino acid/polyamine/organocation transporter (APC superfamily) n=1 Tax=Christiangramia gaetbulicola TaxID=703340 RepID=A0A2T6ALI3_9FLAO|nr:amino acid permease [Christiangramia gaetbulicola]PTX44660.1 amino acid/polyamine/organocation transporter (APC superfamily) [Christiangramia gaetbulicola]